MDKGHILQSVDMRIIHMIHFLFFFLFLQIDCYSFAIVLWALLSWKPPFPNVNPMRILCAVAMYNKRPAINAVAKAWPPEVVRLMQDMWASEPAARPPMAKARVLLQKLKDGE